MNAAPSSPYRRNVPLYYGFVFLMNFALWGGIWIKYLVEERELELKWILLMDLPFWLLVAALQAPTGALADHIGRKRMMAIAGGLFGLTILGFGFTTNYWMLFFDYILWAFAMAAQSGADSALLYDSLKQDGQEGRFQKLAGRGFGLQLTAAMFGVVLGAFVASWTSLAFTVQMSALGPFLAIGCALAMREPPIERAERNYWRNLGNAFSFAWSTPSVRYTLLIGAVLLTGVFGPVVLVQPFLIEHEVSTELFGVLQAPLRATTVVGALLAFRIGGMLGTGRLLLVACMGIIASYGGLALVDASPAFAFFGISSLMAGLSRPVIDAYLNERIPSDRRATVLSLMQLAFSLQVAFFEPALGLLTDEVSITSAFVFSAAYFVVLMPPLLVLWRRTHRASRLASQPAAAGL
ncbi:MAG: MFS transporter [Thermoflexaceae bacterium]|nr:MFS transporter [Thermoflexaceae bacterium]